MQLNYCKVLKIITTVVLVVLFMANSWLIFEYYISSKEVTSSSVKLNYVGKQTMPAIIICREVPFSNVKKNMSKLDKYHPYFPILLPNQILIETKGLQGEYPLIKLRGSRLQPGLHSKKRN